MADEFRWVLVVFAGVMGITFLAALGGGWRGARRGFAAALGIWLLFPFAWVILLVIQGRVELSDVWAAIGTVLAAFSPAYLCAGIIPTLAAAAAGVGCRAILRSLRLRHEPAMEFSRRQRTVW